VNRTDAQQEAQEEGKGVEQRGVGSLDLALGAYSAESGNKEEYKTHRGMDMLSIYFACQGASCVTA
jgi:hypothetical protein